MKSLTEAFKKGLSIAFRGESLHEDWFACRAEWEEEGASFYAIGKRFQCDSDRKADFIAEQIMLPELKSWAAERPNQSPEPTVPFERRGSS